MRRDPKFCGEFQFVYVCVCVRVCTCKRVRMYILHIHFKIFIKMFKKTAKVQVILAATIRASNYLL